MRALVASAIIALARSYVIELSADVAAYWHAESGVPGSVRCFGLEYDRGNAVVGAAEFPDDFLFATFGAAP